MSLLDNTHTVKIGDDTVTVTGKTGLVHSSWTLFINDVEVDSAAAAGDFALRGDLSDGTDVIVAIHQSLVGPTRVLVSRLGDLVAEFEGFVA